MPVDGILPLKIPVEKQIAKLDVKYIRHVSSGKTHITFSGLSLCGANWVSKALEEIEISHDTEVTCRACCLSLQNRLGQLRKFSELINIEYAQLSLLDRESTEALEKLPKSKYRDRKKS